MTYLVLINTSVIRSEASDQIVQPNELSYDTEPGIKVQSGLIGYLIQNEKFVELADFIQDLVDNESIIIKLKNLILKIIVYSIRSTRTITTFATIFTSLLAVSVGITALVCKFTEACTFTLGNFGLPNENLEETFRAYISDDKLSYLSNFVLNSFKKYAKNEKKKLKKSTR